MYRLKLRILSVLSDKIAKQKMWFLLCFGGFAAAPGVGPAGGVAAGSGIFIF
jgi:hypothetical protein